ncbi:alpha/beta fold hydrolase [Nocardia fluminea]|uniref:alpha/beta fold hydrolase n=1 Tax=Nocardia fluminea TaxID=134984 RepID=UPI003427299C
MACEEWESTDEDACFAVGFSMNATSHGSIAERYQHLLRDEFADVETLHERVGPIHQAILPVSRENRTLADGSQISAIRWSAEPARFLLLHGGALNARSWDSVAVSMGAPVIVPDLLGHGHSSWRTDCNYRPSVLAEALIEWMVDACPEPVHIVGQSLGGLTAIELAARAGHQVKSVTVVDITPGRSAESPGSRNVRNFVRGVTRFDEYEQLVDYAIAHGFGTNRASLELGLIHNTRIAEDGSVMFRHHFASMDDGGGEPYDILPMWNTIESLTQPVQLVRGTRGIVDDKQVAEFRRRRPEAPVSTLTAGHNVQRDAPVELGRAVSRFAEKI